MIGNDTKWTIRAFRQSDTEEVADLFIKVNRLLAPPGMEAAFEAYIQRSLAEEIERIEDYYSEHKGLFHVAESEGCLCGMFGLEQSGTDAMELRRMYVAPQMRGKGLGRTLLARAEALTVEVGRARLVLSTSEIQEAALALYRSSGYILSAEKTAQTESLKTVGGGLRRFYFEKDLTVSPQHLQSNSKAP
ncbi:putative acetyltransferase [Cohaesibacter marisflavi]|uniref:Putative acetyltransferase n=1 Tax=Cohaesibacter marisflavi TaxID=655353 RepID=A0A1I4ZAB1_9HYPH|nr:GNAT family N-acetyltransferase [Cohaesibacter marisflavi]SFN47221.1 putative acetyltransferase [Cohaesibacter marisflavi]